MTILPHELQLLENQTRGKRVLLQGTHPWAGHLGTIHHIEYFNIVQRYAYIIHLDGGWGGEAGVFNEDDMLVLPGEPDPA